jgi:hypothetical protein
MTDSDTIIKDLPNVESLTFNYKQWSSFCTQVEGIKDKVFEINEKNIDNINYLVRYIGDMERHGRVVNYSREISDKIKIFNLPLFPDGKHSMHKIRDLLSPLKITVNLYKFNDEFYIEKKTKTTKTYFKLIEPKLFGTGNLSTSLILKASYVFNDNGNFKTKNVCLKVYPLDIYHQPEYNILQYPKSKIIDQQVLNWYRYDMSCLEKGNALFNNCNETEHDSLNVLNQFKYKEPSYS